MEHLVNDLLHCRLQAWTFPAGIEARWLGEGILQLLPTAPWRQATILSAGVHGNETAPIELLLQLTHDLSQGRQPLTQALLIVFGNLPAIRAARRYLHNDLNRLFGGRHLAVTPGNESRRAFALEQAVQAFYRAADAAGPVNRGHLDMHTAIRGSLYRQFALLPAHAGDFSPDFYQLLQASGMDAVVRHTEAGGTFTHFTCEKFAAQSATLELGKVMPFGANDLSLFAAADAAIRAWIADAPLPPRDKAPVDYFLVEESIIKREGEFTLNLAADVENFTALPAGYEIARHIQMIALGGAIGTGLFMGAGRNIAVAGTSILVIYVLVGFFTYMVMRAMGELLLTRHDYRSFADFVGEYLGPQASFYLGWTYWLSWVVTCIADVVVCGSYMQYWFPELSAWMPALSMLAILFLLNLLSVKMFGEAEFWFALIKVITIIALIGTGGWMIATGWTSPDGVTASLSHLTDPTAFMPHGITGFFAGFQIAIFSFTGIELLGTMTAETRDPQRILPKAINALPLRIIIFYLLSMVVIIAVASWPGVSAETSPFVTLFAKAGLPAAAAVINFVALTSAMSSANSGVFSSTRMLYGLSVEKHAHWQFRILSRSTRIPVRSLLFSCFCMLIGTLLLFLVPNVMTLFTIVSTLAAIMVVFSWGMILVAYLVYRRQRPDLHAGSIFKMPAGVVMSWVSLLFFAFAIFIMIFDPDTLLALLASPLWFIALWGFWKLKQRREGQLQLDNQSA